MAVKTLSRLLQYLKKYPLLAIGQLVCAILMTLALVIFPGIVKEVINQVVPEKEWDRLLPLTLMALGSFFIREILNASRILLNNVFEQKIIFDIRSDLYAKLQRLPVNWFDTRRTGDIMSRVMEDVTAMEQIVIDGIEQGLVAILQVLIIGGVLFYVNPEIGAWAAVPIPFLLLSAWLYSHSARDRYRAQREASGDMNALLHDNIAGIRQLKSYTAEVSEHARFNEASNGVRQATLKVMRYWATYSPSTSFLQMCGYSLVLGFGGYAVMKGELDNGEFVQYFLYLSLFYEPIGRLHQLNQMALSARAAADRVFEVLDSKEEPRLDTGAPILDRLSGEIEIKDLQFSYQNEPILKKLSLIAKAGETIALVGPTGAGKSTIVNLLCGFYPYKEGSITIDGKELNELNLRDLRSQIGYVTQEAFLFNGSVRDNLLLAKRDASDDDIWKALAAASAHTFVEQLPEQLDSVVGERGVKLSGGEKQRLSIARALLKNPPILLLDEATASVDNQTEKVIQKALEKLMHGRTCIVIAHRLTTIQSADQIYVLQKGAVVEAGTHHDLLEKNGAYSLLNQKNKS